MDLTSIHRNFQYFHWFLSISNCIYSDCRRSCLYFCHRLRPAHMRAYADWPSKFKHVELSRLTQTSAGIPANHESAPRQSRADALLCIGTYADVYRRIRSRVYTFIHGATCAMQSRRTSRRKRRHLHRLPAHTRACSINPDLHWSHHSIENGRWLPVRFRSKL